MPDSEPLAPSGLPDATRMPALLSHVRQRRCALFVGAGLSRPAGYPGWRGLMNLVLAEAVRVRDGDSKALKREMRKLLDRGRFAEVADHCRQILGRLRFRNFLRSRLSRPAVPPPQTHEPIVRTPYACIVTTNFDTLLEQAFREWSDFGVPKAPTGMRLGNHGTLLVDGAFFILKAHGTIDDEPSLVFTSEDYRRIIHANPAFQSMMAAILLSHALLFVGYSLNDPNFRLLIESQLSIFGTESPPRYALMEGVGQAEALILRRTAGIEVVSYPEGRHEAVAGFLQDIADATRSKPLRSRGHEIRSDLSTEPLPALCLTLTPRNAMLEARWYETHVRDLEGALVPPEKRWVQTVGPLPWAELAGVASGEQAGDMASIGRLLGAPFSILKLPIGSAAEPRLVVLDLPRELSPLPWEWMELDGTPLCLAAPVCRTVPGLDDASRGRPYPRFPLRVLLIGDALAEARSPHPLPETRQEVANIAKLFRSASAEHHVTLVTGGEARYERVLEELSTGGYDIVHVAGVAYVHFHSTGESILPLHDGDLSATEVATLLIRQPPTLVFFNADMSGFVPAFEGGSPLASSLGGEFSDFYDRLAGCRAGFERVVGRAGVGTFIGCMAGAPGLAAQELAVEFYRQLLRGQPVAHALYHARKSRPATDRGTSLLFGMSGYADTLFVPGGKTSVVRKPRRVKTRRLSRSPPG